MRGTTCLLAVCLLVCVFAVWGQEPDATDQQAGELLTLDRAVSIALERNLQIRSAQLGLDAARWAGYQSISGWLPRVDFTTTYNRIDEDTLDRASAGNESLNNFLMQLGMSPMEYEEADADSYTSNITVTQPIINGGAEIGVIMGAYADKHGKQASWRNTVLETVLNVKTAYYNALKARSLLLTAQDAYLLAGETLRFFNARFELGELARPDVLRWEAEAAKAEGEVLAAQNASDLAMIYLVNLMGEDLQAAYVLPQIKVLKDDSWYRKRMEDIEKLAQQPGDFSSILDNHPAVEQMDAYIEGAKAGRALAWSTVLPKLNFAYTYSWETDDDIQLDGDTSWTAGLQLQVPLFHSLSGAFGIVEKRKLFQQSQLARDDAKRALMQRALSAQRSLRTAFLRVRSAHKEYEFAKENLNLQRSQEDVGSTSNLETLDAQLLYFTAQSSYINAASDFLIAESELDYLHAKKAETLEQ